MRNDNDVCLSTIYHTHGLLSFPTVTQEEVDGQKMCIEQLDAQVSKTTNALAMEQALATASQMQKTTVEERMARLIDQIETMHRKWKEEQEARMQRQNEMYARADELRQARVQLIQSNAATRYRFVAPFTKLLLLKKPDVETQATVCSCYLQLHNVFLHSIPHYACFRHLFFHVYLVETRQVCQEQLMFTGSCKQTIHD